MMEWFGRVTRSAATMGVPMYAVRRHILLLLALGLLLLLLLLPGFYCTRGPDPAKHARGGLPILGGRGVWVAS